MNTTTASARITKKSFNMDCSLHVYGKGMRKHVAIFFNWQSSEKGRGFTHAVAVRSENCRTAELRNAMYDWIVNGVELPWYVRYKTASSDSDWFRVPLSLNF